MEGGIAKKEGLGQFVDLRGTGSGGGFLAGYRQVVFEGGINTLMDTMATEDFSKKSFLLLLVFLRDPFGRS